MKKLSKFAIAALAFASMSASATVVNIGGVQFDAADSYGGAQGNHEFVQWYAAPTSYTTTAGVTKITNNTAVTPGTGLLSGVGAFYSFNVDRTSTNNYTNYENNLYNASLAPFFPGGIPSFLLQDVSKKSYCSNSVSGCFLSFAFGGLSVQSQTPGSVVFNTANSFLNIYLGQFSKPTPGFTGGDLNLDAQNHIGLLQTGSPWLQLKFTSFSLKGSVLGGQISSTLDIVGGLAPVASYFDRGAVDFKLTGDAEFGTDVYSKNGGGVFKSTAPVSAPSSLAILGLGLVGLAGLTRRKQAK